MITKALLLSAAVLKLPLQPAKQLHPNGDRHGEAVLQHPRDLQGQQVTRVTYLSSFPPRGQVQPCTDHDLNFLPHRIFWQENLNPMVSAARRSGEPLDANMILDGFLKVRRPDQGCHEQANVLAALFFPPLYRHFPSPAVERPQGLSLSLPRTFQPFNFGPLGRGEGIAALNYTA